MNYIQTDTEDNKNPHEKTHDGERRGDPVRVSYLYIKDQMITDNFLFIDYLKEMYDSKEFLEMIQKQIDQIFGIIQYDRTPGGDEEEIRS